MINVPGKDADVKFRVGAGVIKLFKAVIFTLKPY
jgi:hypothetical protein